MPTAPAVAPGSIRLRRAVGQPKPFVPTAPPAGTPVLERLSATTASPASTPVLGSHTGASTARQARPRRRRAPPPTQPPCASSVRYEPMPPPAPVRVPPAGRLRPRRCACGPGFMLMVRFTLAPAAGSQIGASVPPPGVPLGLATASLSGHQQGRSVKLRAWFLSLATQMRCEIVGQTQT